MGAWLDGWLGWIGQGCTAAQHSTAESSLEFYVKLQHDNT